jgi:uncharacterized protein
VGRSSKSEAETAEKLSIICGLAPLATWVGLVVLLCSVNCLPAPLETRPHTALVPTIVLDTNVVFDWLLFRNPHCEGLGAWLQAGKGRWLVSAAMHDELAHVLGRGGLDKWRSRETALWAAWAGLSTHVDKPTSPNVAAGLHCTDRDDQKFVDLALAGSASWLLSRDRAVLTLTRKARERGLTIQTPAAWAANNTRECTVRPCATSRRQSASELVNI